MDKHNIMIYLQIVFNLFSAIIWMNKNIISSIVLDISFFVEVVVP